MGLTEILQMTEESARLKSEPQIRAGDKEDVKSEQGLGDLETISKGLMCNWRPRRKGENEEEKLFEETVRNYSTFGEKIKT